MEITSQLSMRKYFLLLSIMVATISSKPEPKLNGLKNEEDLSTKSDSLILRSQTQDETLFNSIIFSPNKLEEKNKNISNSENHFSTTKQNVESMLQFFKQNNFRNRNKRQISTYCVPSTNKCLEFLKESKKLFYVENSNLYSENFGVIVILLENNLGNTLKNIIISKNDTYSSIINKFDLKNGMSYKDNYKVKAYMTNAKSNHVSLSNLFEIRNNALMEYTYELKDVIGINNLGIISNNSDDIILNELNYLNPNLNLAEMEITEKNSQHATISAKEDSKEYIGSTKIFYLIGNSKNRVVDLNSLIKKALFFENRKYMTHYTIKKVNKIFTDNIIYSNVEVRKSFEPIINNATKNICSGKTILENYLSEEQNIKTSACRYTIETVDKSQITKGLSRTTGHEINQENSSTSGRSNSETISSETRVSNSEGSSNTIGGEGGGKVNFFGIFELGGSAKGENTQTSSKETSKTDIKSSTTEIMSSMSESLSQTLSLSNNFDLSNTSEIEQRKTYELELPEQEVKVKQNQILEVHFYLDEVTAQVSLYLKQKIYGQINYETISVDNKVEKYDIEIKKLMLVLRQYGLLPPEISINEDDSVNFNGQVSLTKQISTYGQIRLTEIPKSSSNSLGKNNNRLFASTVLLFYIMYLTS